MNEKEPQFQNSEKIILPVKDLYGLDPEMSLLSVNFAPHENALLNENYQEDSTESEKCRIIN